MLRRNLGYVYFAVAFWVCLTLKPGSIKRKTLNNDTGNRDRKRLPATLLRYNLSCLAGGDADGQDSRL